MGYATRPRIEVMRPAGVSIFKSSIQYSPDGDSPTTVNMELDE